MKIGDLVYWSYKGVVSKSFLAIVIDEKEDWGGNHLWLVKFVCGDPIAIWDTGEHFVLATEDR